jgi:hypothetical protein
VLAAIVAIRTFLVLQPRGGADRALAMAGPGAPPAAEIADRD